MTEFQKEAKLLLDPKDDEFRIADLEELQKTLERGATFGIDLPEISRLKLVRNFREVEPSIAYFTLSLFDAHSVRFRMEFIDGKLCRSLERPLWPIRVSPSCPSC